MQDVQDAIFGIIAAKAGIDKSLVSRDTELESLGLESIDTIEAIFRIEETFDISLIFNANRNAADSIVTAGDVVDLVCGQIKGRGISVAP
jgi:acyl carrier protein